MNYILNDHNTKKRISRKEYLKRQRRNKLICSYLFSSLLVLSILFSFISLNTKANTVEGNEPVYKYFTSYQIERGDTLWKIVEKYNPDFSKKEVMKTIDEIRDINHLGAFEKITAGEHLVVPYYSTEYK